MRQVTNLLLFVFFAFILSGCGADDATRSNTFLELTSISISSEHDNSIADLTDNQFTATGDYSGELTRDITTEVTWKSSDENILIIDTTGLATAVSSGTMTVTAELDEVSNSLEFSVSDASIVSLTVTPTEQSAPVGVERDYDVSGTFDDDSTQNLNRIATWSAIDPAVASVTSTGNATGLTVGTTGIQAEWQGVTDVATLNVTESVLTDLNITPADAGYPVGLTIQYTLTGTYSDGSTEDLTAQAFWESSIESRATVNNTAGEEGKVEMLASGNTDITASYTDTLTGDWEATTGLDINNSTLREILIFATVFAANGDIVSENVTIDAGETLSIFNDETVQFTAIGEYSDSAEYDITTQTTWASSDTAIVTISNSEGFEGIATPGNETGEATINASFDTLEIEFTLDVNQR